MTNLKDLDWRENAHLVANGAFKYRDEKDIFPDACQAIYGEFITMELIVDCELNGEYQLDDIILLSRTIESLTIKESEKISFYKWGMDKFSFIQLLKLKIFTESLNVIDFLYLLSLGIWIGSDNNVEFIKE